MDPVNMTLFDDLIQAAEEAVTEASPFRAYSRVIEPGDPLITPIRDDPVFGPVVRLIEAQTGQNFEDLDQSQIRQAVDQSPRVRGELDRARLRAVDETQAMAVTYSDWTGIAFDVAKSKGADFSTTQQEIQAGSAPTSEAISTFASIWRERKDEIMQSRERARAIAREEISVR